MEKGQEPTTTNTETKESSSSGQPQVKVYTLCTCGGGHGGTQYRKTVRKISKYWQESANEPCGSAVKGLPLPNTISQKDKKNCIPQGSVIP